MAHDLEEELAVLRQANRALRVVNRNLRERLRQTEEHSHEVFFALCQTGEGSTTKNTYFDPRHKKTKTLP